MFTRTTHGFDQNFEAFSLFGLRQVNLEFLNTLKYYRTLYIDLF